MTDHINDRPDEQDKHFGDEDAFAANTDAPADESTEFTSDSAGFVSDATTSVDDAADRADATVEGQHDTLDGPEQRTDADQLGQNLRKAAEDTAYAAVGFVGLVSEKAKAFYEDQKKQYADAHPEADAENGAKNFLAQLREQLDRFIEEVNKSFRDLSERGRASGKGEDIADKAERFADDISDAADRAARNMEDFAEGVQRPTDEA